MKDDLKPESNGRKGLVTIVEWAKHKYLPFLQEDLQVIRVATLVMAYRLISVKK